MARLTSARPRCWRDQSGETFSDTLRCYACRRCPPEMECGVASPWRPPAPVLREGLRGTGQPPCGGALQNDQVAGEQDVRIAQHPHREVSSGPWADARQPREVRLELVYRCCHIEHELACRERLRNTDDRVDSRGRTA